MAVVRAVHRPAYWPAWLLAAAVFAVYGVYALSRQTTILTAGYDLGLFDQAVRDYSRFRPPIVPIKGADYNIFGDHFHPIIATAAPLYWIWDSPRTLLLLQAALVAVSVPVVHRFAARRMSSRAALVVAGAYAAGWPLQAMIDFDFHEVAYGVPLLAIAIDALDRRADRTLLAAGAALLLVREDMGVVVALLGLLRLWDRPRWRWPGWALVAAGAVTFVIATVVIVPAYASNGFAYWTFDSLGRDLPDALGNLVTDPARAVRLLFAPAVKSQTLAYLFVPLLLLPLRSRYALVVVPLLAESLFNSREALWTTHYHYSALPWVVLVLAMVDGGARFGLWKRARVQAVVLAWLVVVPLVLIYHPKPTPNVVRRMVLGSAWNQTQHVRDARAALDQVPRDVCVSVDDRLAPQLTARNRVSEPGIASPRTDFVVLDTSQHDVGYLQPSPARMLRAYRDERGFSVVFTRGDFIVLRSPSYTGASSQCGP